MLKKRREVEEDGTAPECCMCGDYGLSSQLFKCKHCRFRFQHKYCSNLYPEADSYNTCNWCLVSHPKDHSSSKSSSPSNSSSSKNNHHRQGNNCSKLIKKRKRLVLGHSSDDDDHNNDNKNKNNNGGPNETKQTSSGSCVAQRVTNGGEKIAKRIIIKKVFRNKVRRYKLLEEVSASL